MREELLARRTANSYLHADYRSVSVSLFPWPHLAQIFLFEDEGAMIFRPYFQVRVNLCDCDGDKKGLGLQVHPPPLQ